MAVTRDIAGTQVILGAGIVILQLGGLPHLRVKGFDDTICGGVNFIKKMSNYRENPGELFNFEYPTLSPVIIT